jgi:hypothetical protein
MNSKAMEVQKRNGGQSAPSNPRQTVEAKRASSPKERGSMSIEKKSWGKIPNK